jgi:hypothetical protein
MELIRGIDALISVRAVTKLGSRAATRGAFARIVLPALLVGASGPSAALSNADLQRVADHSNRTMPRMVAPSLRQDRVEVTGMTLTYLYTHVALSASQLQAMRLSVTQRPHILPGLCAASDTGRMLREGTTFRYVYRGKDGGIGGELSISIRDCPDR